MPSSGWDAACDQIATSVDKVVARCVAMALGGVTREFPCQLPLALSAPTTFRRPRDLTPVFYGCYDWHSAVHSHWALLRARRCFPGADWCDAADDLLDHQFQREALAAEVQFLQSPDRRGFERPYGLAWLLQLTAELRGGEHPSAAEWLERLLPLEAIARERFQEWLPKLPSPIRTGEHSQTAFALGLLIDWAVIAADDGVRNLACDTALRFHANDHALPIHCEPSGHDFLSPAVATADLMRRCLSSNDFAAWLCRAFPTWDGTSDLLAPVVAKDHADGKLAHFTGLNFSRAWMARGIASALPPEDSRHAALERMARGHFTSGLPALDTDEYAVTHWVGSFAVYAVTDRGLPPATERADGGLT